MISLVNGELRIVELEEEVAREWRQEGLRDAFVARGKTGDVPWVTYEGPPTVNGAPALHHMWTSVYKDVYARFQILRGKRVERKAGWDCQGLPVEIAVEKELGLASKQDIEQYGVAEFIERCEALVSSSIVQFERLFDRIAFWVDIDNPYRTMDDDYIEGVWWHLKQMETRGLVVEGQRVMPYCTRCGTVLSSHELGQPEVYRDRADDAAFVALPLNEHPWHLVAWTTTPWTLVANVGAAVAPNRRYGVYRREGQSFVVSIDRASELFGDSTPEQTLLGKDLEGLTYQRPYLQGEDDATPGQVVSWEGVTEEVGTGIVHLAPAFGEEDAEVGAREGLPLVNPMDERGHFVQGPFAGRHVHAVVPEVLNDLEARGLLVATHRYEHSYPHCWRCRNPLVYWAKPSWFISTSEHRKQFVEENERINWRPDSIKHGRFGQWLRDNVDWSIARDRYWGTPLPIWNCDAGHATFIGSRAELSELTGKNLSELRLHRPEVDEVSFPCPECGNDAKRVLSVGDVWLDSGCMPVAQHYLAASEGHATELEPADFICEAIDQTRGWFYSLLAVNALVFGQTPYLNAVCLGHLVDDDGRKMSKSLGNVIDPFAVIAEFGSDGTRWYLFTSGAPWGPRRVSFDAIGQRVRRDLSRLWNVASFYLTYADIEGYTPPGGPPLEPTHVLDRWLLSRLDGLVEVVTRHLEDYMAHLAAEEIAGFIDDLSNWYVRRGRRRYYDSDDLAAFGTLRYALETVSILLAPFCPHLAEGLFRAMHNEGSDSPSVHLQDWPVVTGARDERLEQQMASGRTVASLIRSARTEAGVPVRQPLSRALLFGTVALPDAIRREVELEGNVHDLSIGSEDDVPLSLEAQPIWRRLGPRYKDLVQIIGQELAALSQSAIQELAAGNRISLAVAGQEVEIASEDVAISEHVRVGWVTAQEGTYTVALDTKLNDELRSEFRRRSFVRNVQVARRDAGLELADRINLWLPSELWEARYEIAREVLASTVLLLDDLPLSAEAVRGADFAFQRR